MTAHELGRQLLAYGDVPVVAFDPNSEQEEEVTGIVYGGAVVKLYTDEP